MGGSGTHVHDRSLGDPKPAQDGRGQPHSRGEDDQVESGPGEPYRRDEIEKKPAHEGNRRNEEGQSPDASPPRLGGRPPASKDNHSLKLPNVQLGPDSDVRTPDFRGSVATSQDQKTPRRVRSWIRRRRSRVGAFHRSGHGSPPSTSDPIRQEFVNRTPILVDPVATGFYDR